MMIEINEPYWMIFAIYFAYLILNFTVSSRIELIIFSLKVTWDALYQILLKLGGKGCIKWFLQKGTGWYL